jgi:hypothetical protein
LRNLFTVSQQYFSPAILFLPSAEMNSSSAVKTRKYCPKEPVFMPAMERSAAGMADIASFRPFHDIYFFKLQALAAGSTCLPDQTIPLEYTLRMPRKNSSVPNTGSIVDERNFFFRLPAGVFTLLYALSQRGLSILSSGCLQRALPAHCLFTGH